MAPNFTEPDYDPRYVIPTIDPKKYDDFAVFRETFFRHLDHVRDVEAFRGFAKVLLEMSSEGMRAWQGTFAEATASKLIASVADLRYLQGYVAEAGEFYGDEEKSLTPRNRFYYQAAARMAPKIAALADEMEAELRAGLEEVDE